MGWRAAQPRGTPSCFRPGRDLTSIASTLPAELGPVHDDPGDPVYLGVRLETWLKVGAIAALFALLFWPNLRRLWDKTNPFTGEANWGHAIAVPLIGLYYLYINRDALRAAGAKSAWGGLPIALFGILFFAYGIYPGQNDWFKDIGMVIALFGIVTLVWGWRVMRTAWFPIVFLFCALPWPGLLYSKVAGPLQALAASVAVHVLQMCSVESWRFGTKIFIIGNQNAVRTLNVAEACAGLRSLMTFISVAAAVAFLSNRALWQKIVMVASAVPIAIFCNVMRVSGQGLLDRYVSPQLSESFAHSFVGLIMMIPAFFLILLVGWILQNLFIEEVDDKAAIKKRAAGAPAGIEAERGKVLRRPAAPAVVRPAAAPRPIAAPASRPAVVPPRPAGLAPAQPRRTEPRSGGPQSGDPRQEKP
jgi:exosortase